MQENSKGQAVPPFPPWGDRQNWQAINTALAETIASLGDKAGSLHRSAQSLYADLRELSSAMATAATGSCPSCTTICCLHARPFYNFQDLLYLHLAGLQPPAAGQPVQSNEVGRNHCRYLQTTGCSLNRNVRPWICTWYMCPDMKSLMRPHLARALLLIDRIKKKRGELEDAFIGKVVS